MMKSVLFTEKNAPIIVGEIAEPICKHDEVVIAIKASALNHRDLWISKGMYAKIAYPVTPGSDGCGIIIQSNSSQFPIGKRIVINPNVNWGDNQEFQSKEYTVLGMPTQGTMAQMIAVPEHRIHAAPEHLTDIQAAGLPLAGLTAFRAVCTKGDIKPGQNILITGIGGGVALTAMQFAIAIGANVYCTSGSQEKLNKAIALGAKNGVLYNQPNWHKTLMSMCEDGFDCVIDSAGGDQWNELAQILKPSGKLVFYGATLGDVHQFNLQRLFWKQITICGTTMGSDDEFSAMLAFVEHHKIVPIIDSVFTFDAAPEAFEYMHHGKQFGKIVLNHEVMDQ